MARVFLTKHFPHLLYIQRKIVESESKRYAAIWYSRHTMGHRLEITDLIFPVAVLYH